MVKNGFTRAYGASLRHVISANTNNRFKAFFAGFAVTAVLQSSTATALLATAFAGKEILTPITGLAIMIGADLSTTMVAQILTLNLSFLMPLCLSMGAIMHHFYEHKGREQHIARVLIGLGMIILSLSLIKMATGPLTQSSTLPLILEPLGREPILAIGVAALITWGMHSSLAAVLLVATLTHGGLIDMHLGLLMVLGANFGGAIIPLAITWHEGHAARRIIVGNLIMRLCTLLLLIPLIDYIVPILHYIEPADTRTVVNFHTAFSIILALIFLPALDIVNKLCERFVPQDQDDDGKIRPHYLDTSAMGSPTIALASAARETLRMAEIVQDMLEDTMKALGSNNKEMIENVRKRDDEVDTLNNEIKLYMTKLNQEALDIRESDRYIQILTFATNLEYIGDIIDKSLAELTLKKINTQQWFSEQGFIEIKNYHQKVLSNLRLSQTIFLSQDHKLARELVEDKKEMRRAENETTNQHFKRLRSGQPESIATSSMHLDIIRDYRRINSYITSIAYEIWNNHEKYKKRRRKKAEEIGVSEDVIKSLQP